MTSFDFGEIATPITDEAPCGADLEFDRDYANFMAAITNRLPKTFFVLNRETGVTERFEPGGYDFAADLGRIKTFLAASKDIRLLALACRIAALQGDLGLFAGAIGAIRTVLERFWDAAYPLDDEGDYTERNNTILSLDDRGQVILPLTSARIVDAPRFGAATFRHMQIALGQAQPIASETAVDAGALTQALRTAKGDAVAAAYSNLVAARAAVASINQMLIEHIGIDRARTLRQLPAILDEMIAFLAANAPPGSLEAIAAAAAPAGPAAAAAETPSPEGSTPPPAPPPAAAGGAVEDEAGRIASSADALAALQALRDYFARREPSSPALILVRHAITFVDKSFAEILDALAPQRRAEATFKLGTGEFVLPLDVAAPAAAPADGGDRSGGAEPASFTIDNRQQADRLIRLVRAFYEANEPSSPIPLILARASEYLSRDFLALVGDLLPPATP